MKKRAVAYVCGKGGADTADSSAIQERAVRQFVDRHGYDLVRWYRETGVCRGLTDLDHRPALLQLCRDVMAGDVRTVLLENAERLAHGWVERELLSALLQDSGVEVVSCTENEEVGDEQRHFRDALRSLRKFRQAVLAGRLRGGRQKKKRLTGQCEGKKPYGAYAGEGDVVALIRHLRSEPRSTIAAIAEELNRRGVKARGGGPWHATQVQRVLRPADARRAPVPEAPLTEHKEDIMLD